MKEATGEVSMTMVTIVAVAVIGGILALLWPNIQTWIEGSFGNAGGATCGTGYQYDEATGRCVVTSTRNNG